MHENSMTIYDTHLLAFAGVEVRNRVKGVSKLPVTPDVMQISRNASSSPTVNESIVSVTVTSARYNTDKTLHWMLHL